MFYGALARIGLGRLYTWLTGVALLSTWTAGLLLLNVPAEWAPPLYIILSLGLSATPRLGEANRLRVVFSGPSTFFAHVVTPAALIFSVSIHAFGDHGLVDHWALPISLALATAFYALPPWKPRFVQFTSIVLAGGTVLGIAHALGVSEATVKVRVKGTEEHTVAEGDGPVNALDNALRKALEEFYPTLAEMHLTDFKVRVLNEKSGTASKVRVLIRSQDATSSWGTVGVSENIIEASWQALVDGFSYFLFQKKKPLQGRNLAEF